MVYFSKKEIGNDNIFDEIPCTFEYKISGSVIDVMPR